MWNSDYFSNRTMIFASYLGKYQLNFHKKKKKLGKILQSVTSKDVTEYDASVKVYHGCLFHQTHIFFFI